MSPQERKSEIILRAKELGFDLVRVAPIRIDAKYADTYARWIAAGQHGDMDYLAKRLSQARRPETVVPGARSLICVGVNYHTGQNRQPPPGSGRISCYAVTRDYHKVITACLKKLSHFIESEWDAAARYYVDTGPVLERAFAEAAGIGYIGRNTCIITEKFGSWVFLAVIITDLDLPADTNETKIHCGTCRRCIDDCPTGAINEDWTIDARKCISYLTIENRGPIPVELRKKMGAWLFGCDVCQDVCPHNGRAMPAPIEDFQRLRFPDGVIPLRAVLAMKTDAEFLARFRGTPIMRAKRRGILRNACVVAGNSGDKSLLPLLEVVIERENDDMLREHARWAVEELSATGS